MEAVLNAHPAWQKPEAVSKLQIAPKVKARADEKAEHTW